MNKKKALLIINPCSGTNRKRISPTQIIEQLSPAEFDFTVEETKAPGHTTEIVKEKGNDHDIIICCGGDGTLNETMNGVILLDKKVPWSLDGEFGGEHGNVDISIVNDAYDIYSENNALFIEKEFATN